MDVIVFVCVVTTDDNSVIGENKMISMTLYIIFFQITAWMTAPLIPAEFFLEEEEVAAAVLRIDG